MEKQVNAEIVNGGLTPPVKGTIQEVYASACKDYGKGLRTANKVQSEGLHSCLAGAEGAIGKPGRRWGSVGIPDEVAGKNERTILGK